jgi:hypothetical protein
MCAVIWDKYNTANHLYGMCSALNLERISLSQYKHHWCAVVNTAVTRKLLRIS